MRSHHRFGISVAAWTATIIITIIGTFNPRIAVVVHLWQVVAIGVAVTSTVSLIASRAQAEIVEDLQPPERRMKSI